jgi:hypothetical protein
MRLRAVAIAAAVLAIPAAAEAGAYVQDGCQVSVPDNWTRTAQRAASPDKSVWASVMQASTAAEAIQVEQGLQATKVSEDGRLVMMVSSASFAGKTNKQFHAITKSTPSCIADVTVPAGAGEAQAQAIAATVQLAH